MSDIFDIDHVVSNMINRYPNTPMDTFERIVTPLGKQNDLVHISPKQIAPAPVKPLAPVKYKVPRLNPVDQVMPNQVVTPRVSPVAKPPAPAPQVIRPMLNGKSPIIPPKPHVPFKPVKILPRSAKGPIGKALSKAVPKGLGLGGGALALPTMVGPIIAGEIIANAKTLPGDSYVQTREDPNLYRNARTGEIVNKAAVPKASFKFDSSHNYKQTGSSELPTNTKENIDMADVPRSVLPRNAEGALPLPVHAAPVKEEPTVVPIETIRAALTTPAAPVVKGGAGDFAKLEAETDPSKLNTYVAHKSATTLDSAYKQQAPGWATKNIAYGDKMLASGVPDEAFLKRLEGSGSAWERGYGAELRSQLEELRKPDISGATLTEESIPLVAAGAPDPRHTGVVGTDQNSAHARSVDRGARRADRQQARTDRRQARATRREERTQAVNNTSDDELMAHAVEQANSMGDDIGGVRAQQIYADLKKSHQKTTKPSAGVISAVTRGVGNR